MIDHRAEINAQAQAYLEELRAAAAAAHERVMAGVRLQPQVHDDEPVPPPGFVDEPLPEADPIFATREFDVPPEALGSLVDFDTLES
jgi:hypothetical protein